MKVVKVYGALKKRLGGQGTFELDVNTPAEAIKALTANFKGLAKWMVESEQHGVGYRVQLGTETVKESEIDTLLLPWSDREVFSITPVVTGAGRGTGMLLLGAALIGLSFVTFGTSTLFAGVSSGAVFGSGAAGAGLYGAAFGSKVLGMIGLSLVMGGIGQMLSPAPQDLDMKQANKLQNYSFSGVTNTAQVGTAIPIAYGRLFVGSTVISSGLDVDQEV
ncbi:tail component protein [uncultured Mediterranean phage]|jgi:predicted phage tail protein|nr:tail component protein [uncultured Mediterranean phage]